MLGHVDEVVGRRLRARRRLMDMSQQDLATAAGVTFQMIHKYEAAVCRMSVATLWKLAQALEVDVGYFFAGLTPRAPLVEEREIQRPAA